MSPFPLGNQVCGMKEGDEGGGRRWEGVEVCEAERGWAKKRSSETSIASSYEFCWEMLVVGKESGINIRNSLLRSTSHYVIRRHFFFSPLVFLFDSTTHHHSP